MLETRGGAAPYTPKHTSKASTSCGSIPVRVAAGFPDQVGGTLSPQGSGHGPLSHILGFTDGEEGSPNPALSFSPEVRTAPQGPAARFPSA